MQDKIYDHSCTWDTPTTKYRKILDSGIEDLHSAQCNEAGSGNNAEDQEREGASTGRCVIECSDPKAEASSKNDAKHVAAAAKRCVKYRWYLLRQVRR